MAYPKRKPFKPGYRSLSREEAKMVSWCIKNSIACCVIPARKAETGGYDFCIEIIINGKSNYSPSFKKQEVLERVKLNQELKKLTIREKLLQQLVE